MKHHVDATWALTQKGFSPDEGMAWEALFAQGSGYLQLRGSVEERLPDSPQNVEFERNGVNVSAESFVRQSAKWGCYLPGVYAPHPLFNNQLVNLPWPIGIELSVSGETLDPTKSEVTEWERSLDLRNGCLARGLVWHTRSGAVLTLAFRRFVSAARKSLIVQQVSIRCDTPVCLDVEAGIDSDVRTNGFDHFVDSDCRASPHECVCVVTTNGGDVVTLASRMSGSGWQPTEAHRYCSQKTSFDLKPGDEMKLEKRSALSWERYSEVAPAQEALDASQDLSFDELLAEQTAEWDVRWESCDVRITGDAESQLGVRVALYHLLRAHSGDSRVAIGAKGFAGDAYWGRFYWDTEMYLLPFYLYTRPEMARCLTDFRIRCLPAARSNAREYGYAGARYPWESDHLGNECCNRGLWQYSDHEIHITADVVYGMLHYAAATGEAEYLEKDAACVIIETCRYWMERIDQRNGAPVILAVMGPDEYNPLTNNNAFTNRLVRCSLEAGVRVGPANGVSAAELQSWEETARLLPIPRRSDGLVLQHEAFEDLAEPEFERFWSDRSRPYAAVVHQDRIYRTKSLKQPDVLLLMLLFWNEFSQEEIQAAWDYYLPYCTHDSSLSPGIHGLVAHRLDHPMEEIWEYWRKTVFLDLDPKSRKADQGIHIACCGASWLLAVCGFGGLRTAMETDVLTLEPRLPPAWERLSFPIEWKGQRVRVAVCSSEVEIENLSAGPLEVVVWGTSLDVEPLRTRMCSYDG